MPKASGEAAVEWYDRKPCSKRRVESLSDGAQTTQPAKSHADKKQQNDDMCRAPTKCSQQLAASNELRRSEARLGWTIDLCQSQRLQRMAEVAGKHHAQEAWMAHKETATEHWSKRSVKE